MATETIWNGNDPGNEGDLNTSANWGNGLPSPTNMALFISGAQDVLTGLSHSGDTWFGIYVGPLWTGKLATAAGFLQVQLSNFLFYEGIEDTYIDIASMTSSPANGVNVDSGVTTKGLNLKTNTGVNALGLVRLKRGLLTMDAGDVTKLLMNFVANRVSDSVVTLNTGMGTISEIRKLAGTLTQNAGTITDLHQLFGEALIKAGTLTNLHNWGGDTLWETTVTLVNGFIYGGKFDASGDPRARTIDHIEMHGEAEVDLDNGRDNITLTEGKIFKYGVNLPNFTVGSVDE